jgi:hypothetical protein
MRVHDTLPEPKQSGNSSSQQYHSSSKQQHLMMAGNLKDPLSLSRSITV